jgi:hypothetical protein
MNMTSISTKPAPIQASSLAVGDLIACGEKFAEVLDVKVRAENYAGEATELYVTISGKDRTRKMTIPAALTVIIRGGLER